MKTKKNRLSWRGLCLCALWFYTLDVVAANSTVTIKVAVVVPPPCVINGDRPIEVEFGEVMTSRIDGISYRRPVEYTLSCVGGRSNAMKLQVQGTAAAFDASVLSTSKTGLGIKLQQGESDLAINSWLSFTLPKKPELWAVPVKDSGITLTGGEFEAGATMKVDYQ